MKLWNESIVTIIKPTLKVKMYDGKCYDAKIICIVGNSAKIRVDKSNSFQKWQFFYASLGKIADALNNDSSLAY